MAALKSYLWFAADKDISLQSIALSIGRVKACRNPKKEKPILDEDALSSLQKGIRYGRIQYHNQERIENDQ